MNDLYLQLMSYGHSAIVSLERAIDIADRTYLFSKAETAKPLLLETDLSNRYDFFPLYLVKRLHTRGWSFWFIKKATGWVVITSRSCVAITHMKKFCAGMNSIRAST